MKLLIDATPLLKDLSGVGYVTYQYAKELKKLQNDTYFYYAWFYSSKLRQRPLGGYEKAVSFVKRFVPRPYQLTHAAKTAIFNYTLAKLKPDAFIQPNYISFESFYDVPTYTFIHDLSHIRYKEFHPKERVEYFEKRLQKSIQNSKKIITISNFTKNELIELNLANEDMIEVIPNGVDDKFGPVSKEEFEPTGRKFRVNYKRFFLYVGTLEPRKNLKNLLLAYLDYLKETKEPLPLILAGGIGWRSEHFDDVLQKALQSGYVKLAGYVAEEELIHLYGGALAFLFPSFYEGFGLPPLEAMACKTAVISSNTSSIPEVTGDAAILIDPHSPKQIKDAMINIQSDSALASALAQKGLDRSRQFSWEKSAKRLYEIVKNG